MSLLVVSSGIFLRFLNECHSIGRDAFHATRKAEPLSGGGLDGYGIRVTAYDRRHRLLHLWYVGIHLGPLSTDGGIDVDQPLTLRSNEFNSLPENNLAVHA